MNYNDQILDNKAFKFAKQLIYNLAISICIILAVCLVFVYGFHYRPYNVITGSMEPVINVGDMVIVHSAKEYKVGDVLKFDEHDGQLPTVHRIIAIKDGVYVCHGDNTNYSLNDGNENWTWQQEAEIAATKTLEELRGGNYQFVDTRDGDTVEGKVVAVVANYGTYINFISEHKVLFITIVLGLWCFTYVVQNEIEIRKARRLA